MNIQIRNELRPGDMGTIIHMHGTLYAREYGFDNTFEPYVAEPLSRFILNRTEQENVWIAEKSNRIIGSAAVVKFSPELAQLRWLLVHPEARGLGLGKNLVLETVEFSKKAGYKKIFLWTVNILPAAAHIYLSFGFKKTEERKQAKLWGRSLREERYEIDLI